MNLKEFKSLKDETTTYLINYEHFCKRSYLLDMKYYLHFGKTLSKIMYLKKDNDLMFGIANLYKENKMKELDKLIEDSKKQYAAMDLELNKKINKANNVFYNPLTKEDEDKLNDSFDDLVTHYHPAITMSVNQNERQSYEMLKNLFYENNVLGYFAYYDLVINNFKELEISNADYDKIGAFYQKTIFDIRAFVVENQEKYPFNFENIFEDEILIARHQGDLDVEYSKLVEENKALHVDITNILNKDIRL